MCKHDLSFIFLSLQMVSNHTLMKIAGLGGFVIGGTGYFFHFRIQHNIRESDTYKDVINTLYMHKKAVPYLGKPVSLGRVKYGNGMHMLERKIPYKWFNIPLTGTNTKGKLYYEVTLNNECENKFEVSKIEITFDNIPGKTFVIRDYDVK